MQRVNVSFEMWGASGKGAPFEMGLLEGFLSVKMGRAEEKQKRYTTQRLVHMKVTILMTINNDPMECTAILPP